MAAFVLLVGWISWSALCRDGNFDRCMNGTPSFELVFQAGLSVAALIAAIATRILVGRRAYRVAGATLLLLAALFIAWGVFLDAATHGWDDLKFFP